MHERRGTDSTYSYRIRCRDEVEDEIKGPRARIGDAERRHERRDERGDCSGSNPKKGKKPSQNSNGKGKL